MRIAIVTRLSDDGVPTTVVPIMSGDLADAVLGRLSHDARAMCETALREAFAAEENAVRAETIHLGAEHE